MFNPNEHLMDLKGKDYLQVMWRLVWFREEKPMWCIDTEMKNLTENHAVFCAKIFDENGSLKASGYGSESVKDFKDFIEKAETKAIGRALAMLGYGTQFAPELDEGERIVDSPVAKAPIKKVETEKKVVQPTKLLCSGCKVEISKAEFDYSANKCNGLHLCRKCQKEFFDGQKRVAKEGAVKEIPDQGELPF